MNQLLVLQVKPSLWRSIISVTITTCSTQCSKSASNREGKTLSKLFGKRMSGSKKRWFESPASKSGMNSTLDLSHIKKNDHSSNRRMAILNKLFMAHITDLLATGEASQKILGKGLQITRVKVTSNFQLCNVYWMVTNGAVEVDLEKELEKCAGLLRHELSQLRLMGQVPRMQFVQDKTYTNLAQVDMVLKSCDFGEDHQEIDPSYQIKNDLYRNSPEVGIESTDGDYEDPLPEMRHDVFGLDHRAIMLKILAKMKKSEQAWLQYERGEQPSGELSESSTLEKINHLEKNISKMGQDEELFNKFLSNLGGTRRKRERFLRRSDGYYSRVGDDESDPLDDGDYIDEVDDEKK